MMQFSRRRIPLLLEALDRLFPPNPGAFMSCDEQTRHEIVKAEHTMGVYLQELAQTRTVSELDILDFGCGWGGETLWLARHARSVRGVDVDEKAIGHARKACDTCAVGNCGFEWSSDGGLPFADASFDAVLSTDTFEHVMDLDLAFSEIARVLKPGGSLLTRFGPLFRSPHGYHLYWACQVPYAHLLFGLDAIAAMRANRGGSAKQPASWRELGLNGQRFRDYAASVERAGLEIVRFRPIPVKGLTRLAAAPLIGDLFIFGVDCHVRRPQEGRKAER
jgi:SAM-dependent methyltransferase